MPYRSLGVKRTSSEVGSMMGDNEDFSNGLLLRDIEEISKALYLPNNPLKSSNSYSDFHPNMAAKTGTLESKSKVITQYSPHKDKKSSMWNWKKPLKAFTHTRNRRYNCHFFLHVHCVEGLPSNFNGLNLCVTWKRKGDVLRTSPSPVCEGIADFEETLTHQCAIYANKSGTRDLAKYEPKLFLLHTSVIGAPAVDMGKNWIDLTRLLPLTLEELEGENRGSGKWTTSFKLTGKAEGAMLNVSFGFSILDGTSFDRGCLKVPEGVIRNDHFTDFDSQLENLGSVSTVSTQSSNHESQSIDVNSLDNVFSNRESELGESITLLYRKLDEEKMSNLKEFDFFHDQLESPEKKSGPLIKSADENTGHEYNDIEFTIIEQGVEISRRDEVNIEHQGSQRFDGSLIEMIDVEEIFKEEYNGKWSSELDRNVYVENEIEKEDTEPTVEELGSVFYDILQSRSMDLDSLLGVDKFDELEFGNETKSSYNASSDAKSLCLDGITESIENDFLNMLSIESPTECLSRQFEEDDLEFATDFDLTFGAQAVENNLASHTQSMRTRRNAKLLENLETKSLMHEWGLNEKAFQNSRHGSSSGFGSPVYIPREEPLKLPYLGEGLGPIIQTRDGFLRSLNPLLYRNAKNGARLIVQVSAPAVLPPAMGFNSMNILQCWASGGSEKMSTQAKELMPLEDITEKIIQQMVTEAKSRSFVEEKTVANLPFLEKLESENVSLENLVPLAIQSIEGLLIEGLKIQSGMQDQEAPSSISIQFSSNELVKYSVSLEKWMKLCSGDFDTKDETDEDLLKVFASHHSKSTVSGNNFMMALRVQLRDPLRNYETVGSTMLAIIHVEMVYSPLVQEGVDFSEEHEIAYEEGIPMFKVLEVHLAGLNVLVDNNKQKQSGSRWLLSSGMSRANNIHISNSNSIIKSSSRRIRKTLQGNILWSISSNNQGEMGTWDESVALNVHVRNPDIIFPN